VAVVLDSTVIAGFLDRGDALHDAAHARVRALLPRDALVTSVVTYAELLTGAGLGHHPAAAVHGFFADLISEILPVDAEIAERAADLRTQRRSLRMPDAFILATADLHPHIDLVLGGDEQWGKLRGLSCQVELLG
jgi:predicted nucleic acid-binding protein